MALFAAHRPSSTLTLRTPIRPYAVVGRGLGVPVGNEKLPGGTPHAGGFYFGIIQCVNTTSIWLALLYASKERRRHAPKAKSKAGPVMADSWRETVKLQEMLIRHAEFIRKVPMPRARQGLSHAHRHNQHQSACDLPVLRRTYALYTNSAQGWRPTRNADIRVQAMPPCGYGSASTRHYGNGLAVGRRN